MEMNWYEERIEWKNNLRAELHYNFVLKKRTYQRFAVYYVRKKTKKLKIKIAEIMFEKNFRKRILKSTFSNWKHFSSRKKTSKMKKAIADQYFKNNFRTGKIRFFFVRWKIFTLNRRALKLKMEEAHKYYLTKLISRVFNAFFTYITYRKMRRDQMERVDQFYFYKLKEKTFNKLMSYKLYKSFQRNQIQFAYNFYQNKLLRHAMRSFWINLERRLYKKERLALFAERKVIRMKKTSLKYWKMYAVTKKMEQQKFLAASEFYDSRCKKKYFRKWKIYRLNRKLKKNYQTMKLDQVKSIFERGLLRICFSTWKAFTYNETLRKEKFHLAEMNYKITLKKKCVRLWILYKNYRKMKRRKIVEVELFHYRRTLQRSFDNWKIFNLEQRSFASKKVQAKKYYQQCLVKETFKLMIKSALREKDDKLDRYLENERRRLILARKYGRTWKIKSKSIRRQKQSKMCCQETKVINLDLDDKGEQRRNVFLNKFIGSIPESFVWDPICFARPRVPEYMKKNYEDP